MTRRISAFRIFVLIASAVLAHSQIPPEPETPKAAQDLVLHIDVDLVQIDAVVYDRHDRPVTGLTPADFEILEDGKPQPVTAFSYVQLRDGKDRAATPSRKADTDTLTPTRRLTATDVKRTIVLIADDLNLSWESTAYLRRALKKFIDTQMGPNDIVSIARTSTGLGALETFTNDKRQLYAAADSVRFNLNGRAAISAFDPSDLSQTPGLYKGSPHPGSQASDQVFEGEKDNTDYLYVEGTMNAVSAIIDNLRAMPGRKAVILFSDGVFAVPRGEFYDRIQDLLHKVADSANRSSVVLNCVDARGLQTLAPEAADARRPNADPTQLSRSQAFAAEQYGLIYLAAQTGGRAVLNGNDMSWAIDRILDDLDGYYLIGYRPEPGTFHKEGQAPAFHHIQVRLTKPGLSVRSRSGFFGLTNKESDSKPLNDGQKLLTALQSPFGATEIPLRLTVQFLSDGVKRSSLSTLLHIDAHAIDFKKGADEKYHAQLELLLTGYDENGRAVEGANNVLDLSLPEEQYRSALADGMVYSQQVPIRRTGAAHVRVAVRDVTSGHLGSASEFVLLPDLKRDRMVIGTVVLGGNGTDSANRVFKATDPIPYRYSILNSRKSSDDVAKVETEVRLFHEGRQVWASTPTVTEAKLTKDSQKLVADSALHLSTNVEPGEYYLQVIARDLLASKRAAPATQWINFDLRTE